VFTTCLRIQKMILVYLYTTIYDGIVVEFFKSNYNNLYFRYDTIFYIAFDDPDFQRGMSQVHPNKSRQFISFNKVKNVLYDLDQSEAAKVFEDWLLDEVRYLKTRKN
jgi:hypothetical protein